MASHTQFYMTRASQRPWQPSGFQGTWNLTSVSTNTGYLVPYKGGGNNISFPRSETSATDPFKVCLLKMLLGPLSAQIIGGTVDVVLGALESDAAANLFWALHLYVSVGESDSVRGTLLSNYVEDTTNEWPTTAAGLALQSAQTLTPVACQQGDWVILEIGYVARNSSTSSFTGTMRNGSTGITALAGQLADLTVGSTSVDTRAGFLTFANGIDLYEPAPETDDVIASNLDLWLYDGTTGAIKKRVFLPRYYEPAGGIQDRQGLFYVTEELNNGFLKFNTNLDGSSWEFFDAGEELPHAICRNAADELFIGYTGDGSGTTSCGDQGFSANADYPSTTGSIATGNGTFDILDNGPYQIIAGAAGDRDVIIDVTVTQTFSNGDGTQPTFEIGETGDTNKFAPTSTFTNNVLNTTYRFTGTLSSGADLLVTAVAGTGSTETGGLSVTASAVGFTTQTLLASSGSDRNVLINLEVTQTFADGTGQQPEFAVGYTGDTDFFLPVSTFTDRTSGSAFNASGLLPAGAALLVTAKRAIPSGAGALHAEVLASGLPDADTIAIRTFSTAGVAGAVYNADPDQCGTNSIDLASDQRTMFYTSLGRLVKRYDVVADTQLADFATLPPAGTTEMARGIRVLPSGGVAVADVVDIKVLDVNGVNTLSLSINGQADWGTLALDSTGRYLWAANTANSFTSPPMIAKFDLSNGDVLLQIEDPDVPDTGGALCSGGISIWNGYRAGTGQPPVVIVYPDFEIRNIPRRWLRRSPIYSKENSRVRYNRFWLDFEAGQGNTNEPGLDPTVYMRTSDDWGQTWSSVRSLSAGKRGQYNRQVQFWRCGVGRNKTFEVSGSDPCPVAITGAFADVEPGND